MKRIICIRFVALFVLLTMILSACSDKNKTEDTDSENKPEENQTNDTDSENNPEENRYINCAPQYNSSSEKPCTPDGTQTYTWTWEDYLKAKEESGFTDLDNWLSWEQFSALGEFHKSFWWDGSPESSQYEYLYTDEATGKTWIYHVEFDKIPENSGVTNIKEYEQWYYGREILNHPHIMNQPTFESNSFANSDLTAIDLNDPIVKDYYPDLTFAYYVDDVLRLSHFKLKDSVSCCTPKFVYNGWLIKIFKKSTDGSPRQALDNTDPEILQKLVNANTYKEAIEELMNPANKNLPKQPIDSEIARQIKKGMTYSEIHEILRNPGEDIGSGAILYEWELDNGDVLHVWFQSSGNLIATEVRIDQKS